MNEEIFNKLARLGFAARGAVYVLVGALALLAALGRGGAPTDTKGALATVLSQPLGYIMLGTIALGLFCFSAWRFAQSILNADGLGDSTKERMRRVGYFFSGLINTGLAVSALGLLNGVARASSGDQNARDWTAWLLSFPWGQWLVGVVGAIIIGVGFGVARRAWKAEFDDKLNAAPDVEKWVIPMGQAGFFARALVFVITGGFLVAAAWSSSAAEARGLAGALQTLQQQPYGWLLLTLTAGGLVLFGVFQFVLARYRTIDSGQALSAIQK